MLHIGFKPKDDIDALNMIYRLKGGFGPPDRYPGENVEEVQLKDGRFVWFVDSIFSNTASPFVDIDKA